MTERQRITRLLARCHDDPVLFNDVFLTRRKPNGDTTRKPLWWRQREIAESVVRNRITVVYSGNAIGKDYLVGTIVPWWLWTRAESLVIVTGPSQTLLGTVTWKNIRQAIAGARFPMGAGLSQGPKASPQTVTLGGGWQALGYSTTSVERASGQHNRNLLAIMEEASGAEDEAWDALDSLKFTRLLAIGNPIRADGRFVELIRQAEQDRRDGVPPHKRVHAIRVPSTDSPHADLDSSPYGLADRTWLDDCYRRYGRDSLWVRSHIDAVVPSESSDVLIPEKWLDWCPMVKRRYPPLDPRAGKRRISCDLGEGVGRDSTCVRVRDDLGVLETRAGSQLGLAEAAQAIAEFSARWSVAHTDVTYDKLGLGKNLPNHLARHGIRDAVPYAGGASPRDALSYPNLRTEAAFAFARRIDLDQPDPRNPHAPREGFHIPADRHWPQLREELRSLRYDLVGGKFTRLITKEDLCARLGRSPDSSDALLQSFAFP